MWEFRGFFVWLAVSLQGLLLQGVGEKEGCCQIPHLNKKEHRKIHSLLFFCNNKPEIYYTFKNFLSHAKETSIQSF